MLNFSGVDCNVVFRTCKYKGDKDIRSRLYFLCPMIMPASLFPSVYNTGEDNANEQSYEAD